MRVLVIGANGMIGSAVLRILSEQSDLNVFGTIRNGNSKRFFSEKVASKLIVDIDAEKLDLLVGLIDRVRPDVIINCAGLTKHKLDADDPLLALPINALMPHRVSRFCNLAGARFIHVSTDCVFSGKKGAYVEDDIPDALDIYGKSKILGEVSYPNAITLRTSTIGHELESRYGLLDWFLSQGQSCRGYKRAIFSGLPTVVFAQLIRDVVIPQSDLSGLYHIAATPINKFDLLTLIAKEYDKKIQITPNDEFVIDRSLDATKFHLATGYLAPNWEELIRIMHTYQ